jgi:hypothetical protein
VESDFYPDLDRLITQRVVERLPQLREAATEP